MWQAIIEHLKNFLVPESVKIKKLLDLPAAVMRDLLPKSPVYLKDIFVLFDYQNQIIRFIVKSIKYKNHIGLRKRVAVYLYEELLDISSDIILFEGALPLILPMPMSKKEKRERGFSQCEELAKEIKKLGGQNISVSFDALKKIRETERQTKLSREERLSNMQNCMIAVPKQIQGRTIIILDDVYTTGASFLEARRALLAAGAKQVSGLFIAH